jgi:hypothetical protein
MTLPCVSALVSSAGNDVACLCLSLLPSRRALPRRTARRLIRCVDKQLQWNLPTIQLPFHYHYNCHFNFIYHSYLVIADAQRVRFLLFQDFQRHSPLKSLSHTLIKTYITHHTTQHTNTVQYSKPISHIASITYESVRMNSWDSYRHYATLCYFHYITMAHCRWVFHVSRGLGQNRHSNLHSCCFVKRNQNFVKIVKIWSRLITLLN